MAEGSGPVKPKLPPGGHIITPKPNSHACPACTILVPKGSEPPDCVLTRCPRKLVSAPTDESAWREFIASAGASD